MKIIIEGKLYDSSKTPIILMMGRSEKMKIKNMARGKENVFSSFPDSYDVADMDKAVVEASRLFSEDG